MRVSTHHLHLVAARVGHVVLQVMAKGPYVLKTNNLWVSNLECSLHLSHFFLKDGLVILLFLGGKIAIHLNFTIHFYYNLSKLFIII